MTPFPKDSPDNRVSGPSQKTIPDQLSSLENKWVDLISNAGRVPDRRTIRLIIDQGFNIGHSAGFKAGKKETQ